MTVSEVSLDLLLKWFLLIFVNLFHSYRKSEDFTSHSLCLQVFTVIKKFYYWKLATVFVQASENAWQ